MASAEARGGKKASSKHKRGASLATSAAIFAALGDETRMSIVHRLAIEGPLPLARLAEGASMSRQGVSKHLSVLERAGVLARETPDAAAAWELRRARVDEAKRALDAISARWDVAIGRLRALVED